MFTSQNTNPKAPYITGKCLAKMQALIDNCSTEISWFCLVAETQTHEDCLYDVIILDQRVSGITTEIDTYALEEWSKELIKTEKGRTKLERSRAWGHSHVNMGIFASEQDNIQMLQFAKGYKGSYSYRLIGNKRKELRVDRYSKDGKIQDELIGYRLYDQEPTDHDKQKAKEWAQDRIQTLCHPMTWRHPNAPPPKPFRFGAPSGPSAQKTYAESYNAIFKKSLPTQPLTLREYNEQHKRRHTTATSIEQKTTPESASKQTRTKTSWILTLPASVWHHIASNPKHPFIKKNTS